MCQSVTLASAVPMASYSDCSKNSKKETMSFPADSEIYKNGPKQQVESQQNRKSRNSNRRKPKNISNFQDEECDEKIREIINSLSNAIVNNGLGKMYQDKPFSEKASRSTDYSASVNQNYEIERNIVQTDDKRRSDSDKCSVSLIKNVGEVESERHAKQKNKSLLSNSDLCKEENLKMPLEKLKTKNAHQCKKMIRNKHKLVDSVNHCSEARGVINRCVINKTNSSEQQCLVSETHDNVICKRHDHFRSDENSKNKHKVNKVKKSQETAKAEGVKKRTKMFEEGEVVLEKLNDGIIFVTNSTLNYEEERTEKEKRIGCSKEDKSGTPKSSKSKKKWLTDTKFPKYLTEEEMDCVSRFGILLSGVIRINQKNFEEAYISAPDGGMDILIMGLIDRNRALEGDEVYYVLKGQEHFRTGRDDGEIQRTAAVVAIKNAQHCRGAVGTLKIQDTGSRLALFSPRDARIPRLLIRKRDWPPWFSEDSVSSGKRLFYAKIREWNDVRYAEGVLTKEVGHVGDIDSETSAILLMYELDESPYPDSLRIYLPKLPYVISDVDLANRRDLRKECIFTIDPASAKDLDDAVSCKRLSNGNYQIGVHISDVTHFLPKGSPLDAAVAEKATTIYLVQKVYHMLPRELCELCSLTPGEDKLAFSVIWEMTPEFEIVMYNFTRSVINSCGKFSYDQVQEILDGSENPSLPALRGGHTIEDVIDTVKMLNTIAVHLRKKRFDNGALRIDQTKIVFSLDEAGLPLNYHVYINKESHRLIEEFMLLANITVAQWISLYFPKVAFLRSHSPPQSFMMKRLQKELEKYGIDLDISSSKSLHESLLKYSGSDSQSTARMMVLNTFLAKPMARANYYCSAFTAEDDDKRHYALNVPLYTHFTSPIRRYADVIVHRLLAASLGYCNAPDWRPEELQKIADNCNKKKYAAKLAGEKSTELFLNKYILALGSLICQGAVCDVKQKFFDCILLENGSHQRVYLENMKVAWSVKCEDGIRKMIINWPKNEDGEKEVQVIERFSVVKVQLRKFKEEKNIKAILLRPD